MKTKTMPLSFIHRTRYFAANITRANIGKVDLEVLIFSYENNALVVEDAMRSECCLKLRLPLRMRKNLEDRGTLTQLAGPAEEALAALTRVGRHAPPAVPAPRHAHSWKEKTV